MALTGKPAVLDPRAFDLRAVQSTIAAIRERLRTVDIEVNALIVAQAAGGTSAITANVTALQQQLLALTQRVTNLESALGANDTVVLTASSDMSAGAPAVPDGSTSCKLFDPTDPEAVFSCIGLVVSAVSAGQQVTVQRRGAMSITGAAFDQGRAVYADFGGDLTQYPSYGIVAGPVGVATGASTVWISPDDPALLMLSSAGTYEQFMPAAVRLVLDQDDLLQEQIDDLDALVAQLQYDMPALPLDIAYGGTGQTTANDALNALLPAQAGHAGEVLSTDGTDTSWIPAASGSTAPRKIAVFSTLRV